METSPDAAPDDRPLLAYVLAVKCLTAEELARLSERPVDEVDGFVARHRALFAREGDLLRLLPEAERSLRADLSAATGDPFSCLEGPPSPSRLRASRERAARSLADAVDYLSIAERATGDDAARALEYARECMDDAAAAPDGVPDGFDDVKARVEALATRPPPP